MSHAVADAGALRLTAGEVHGWCVGLDVSPGVCERLHATLARDECSRNARFRFADDQRRFIVARGALRDLLARYLGIHPTDVRFEYNAFGKPALSPVLGSDLTFNVSHSAGLGFIAVAAAADIGVDVESVQWRPDYQEVARQFFSVAELAHLDGLPAEARADAFFRCWTKKEALVKARGEGLGMALRSFPVPLDGEPGPHPADLRGASADPFPGRRWTLHTLRPAPGYIGALAVEGDGRRLVQRTWQPPRQVG